jgi:hypothetical protein
MRTAGTVVEMAERSGGRAAARATAGGSGGMRTSPIQRHIALALQPPLAVVVGLSVADEDERGGAAC